MSTNSAKDAWAALLDDPAICEVGGEHTNEGIDYARYLAMALLVEMERAGLPDYALLFEFLQDIAVVDSQANPTTATLLQVKKKSRGIWTKAVLCRKEQAANEDQSEGESDVKTGDSSVAANDAKKDKGKKKRAQALGAKSPLGKLYLCVEKLSSLVETNGVFISNAGHDLRHSNGGLAPVNTKVEFKHLHADDIEYIEKKLSSELKQAPLSHLARLAVEQSKIVPAAMRETVRGLLDVLLSEKYPHLPNISGRLQERLLAAFSSCSGPPGTVFSFADVLNKKGFTRKAFGKLIEELASTRVAAVHLDNIIDGLKSEGMPARAADRIRAEASRLQIQLVREPQTKEVLLWEDAIEAARATSELQSYTDSLNAIMEELTKQKKAKQHGPINDLEAKAVALLAIIYVDQEPKTPGSESADQIQ